MSQQVMYLKSGLNAGHESEDKGKKNVIYLIYMSACVYMVNTRILIHAFLFQEFPLSKETGCYSKTL